MSYSAWVHIKYSKELEEKIRKMPGIITVGPNKGDVCGRIRVPEELFPQHKKETDAHRWVKNKGIISHYDPQRNPGKWEYLSHGFEIWLDYEGDIVFIVPVHWDFDHGHWTLLDIADWIEDNLGNVEIVQERVS